MSIVVNCISFFAFLIVVLAFFKLRLSIALYISYIILVPFPKMYIVGNLVPFKAFVYIALLLSFLYQLKLNKKTSIDFTVINPFLFLFLSLLLLSFFSRATPLSFQLNSWSTTFLSTCILPFVIWNIAKSDSKILGYIKYTLIISIIISCLYGLLLLKLNGLNPYTSFLAQYFGSVDVATLYSSSESRLSFSSAGKIQSTMIHPMTWALFLCFMILLFVTYSFRERNKWYWSLILLMIFNLLTSGVRTGIAALMIGAVYYFFRNMHFKMILYTALLVIVSYTVISSNNDLSNLASSFSDFSGEKSDVKGSSISMRLNQLSGSFKEIRGHELVGKGYSWNSYYQLKHGDHPVLFAFESLIFVVLCNSGIIGIFIWSIFFILLFRLQRKKLKFKKDIFLMDVFVLVFIAYAIGTGEYKYLEIFSLFYTLLLLNLIRYNKNDKINKNKKNEERNKINSILPPTISSNS